MRWAVGGTVWTRRLALAAATVACLLAVCAAWVGAAVPRPNDVVELRLPARDRQPAAIRGHVCVTDAAHGTICAAFSAGQRPIDSLAVAIERRGLRPNLTTLGD
jgi:hypothetical protein